MRPDIYIFFHVRAVETGRSGEAQPSTKLHRTCLCLFIYFGFLHIVRCIIKMQKISTYVHVKLGQLEIRVVYSDINFILSLLLIVCVYVLCIS